MRNRNKFFWPALVVLTALLTMTSVAANAAVSTDQADYTPGSVVTVSGDNSNGAGYFAGNTVDVAVSGPNGWSSSCSATVAADGNGSWSCTVTLASDPAIAVGDYSYTATSLDADGNTISESGTFTDGPPADYDGTFTSTG